MLQLQHSATFSLCHQDQSRIWRYAFTDQLTRIVLMFQVASKRVSKLAYRLAIDRYGELFLQAGLGR